MKKINARLNVVNGVGIFQGILGLDKAVVLLQKKPDQSPALNK